jgi:hypothetical protein
MKGEVTDDEFRKIHSEVKNPAATRSGAGQRFRAMRRLRRALQQTPNPLAA